MVGKSLGTFESHRKRVTRKAAWADALSNALRLARETETSLTENPTLSFGWSDTIERPLIRELTSPFTDPNRSECTLTYSHSTIKSLTLLFGQTMYVTSTWTPSLGGFIRSSVHQYTGGIVSWYPTSLWNIHIIGLIIGF